MSAGHQLTCFHAQSGSSAYARELVSPLVGELAALEDRGATSVALRPSDPAAADELCARVYADSADIITHRRVEQGACILEFDSAASKQEHGEHLRVDDGPYRLSHEVPLGGAGESPCTARILDDSAPMPVLERIELARKQPGGIDEIHLIAMPSREQWRRLFARDIDVVASAPTMHHARFAEMQSVHTVLFPSWSAITLFFNTRAGAWSSNQARKRLAATLDLDAVARVACRDPRCRDLGPFAVELEPAPLRDAGLPARIVIALMADDSASVKAARVISYQLRKQLDIEVRLDLRPVTEIRQISVSGDFDLLLLPLSLPGAERADELLERIEVSGWHDRDFEQAIEQGRDQDIAAILGAELPVLPLFRYLQFAAIDERYCGAEPMDQTSWRWLGDLRPCEGTP